MGQSKRRGPPELTMEFKTKKPSLVIHRAIIFTVDRSFKGSSRDV